jgi:hypothetical protein
MFGEKRLFLSAAVCAIIGLALAASGAIAQLGIPLPRPPVVDNTWACGAPVYACWCLCENADCSSICLQDDNQITLVYFCFQIPNQAGCTTAHTYTCPTEVSHLCGGTCKSPTMRTSTQCEGAGVTINSCK